MSTAHPLPPSRKFLLRRSRPATPVVQLQRASGNSMPTAPYALTAARERIAPVAEPTEAVVENDAGVVVIAEPVASSTGLVAAAADPIDSHFLPEQDATEVNLVAVARKDPQQMRITAPISVERWEEPAAPTPTPHVASTPPTRTLTRPPWLLVVSALAVVGLIVWWFTANRTPTLDAQRVIESQLRAAQEASDAGHYASPYEGSALHHFSTVLTIDASNARALAGMQRLADQLLEKARANLAEGRYADAVLSLNGARRIDPAHPGLPYLEGDLRKQLQNLTARERAEIAAASAATPAAVPPPIAKPVAKKAETPPAQVANAASTNSTSGAGVSVPKATETIRPAPPAASETKTLAAAPEPVNAPPAHVAASNAQPNGIAPLAAAAGAAGVAANIDSSANAPASGSVASPETSADAPAPAAQGATETPKRVAKTLPRLSKYVQPEYPDEARVRGIEGWADLSFLLTANGDVVDPRVEDSSRRQLFGRPALVAVRKWHYEPPGPDHPTLTERTKIRIEFHLTK